MTIHKDNVVIAYHVQSPITNMGKIEEVALLFVSDTKCVRGRCEKILSEFDSAVKEKLGTMKGEGVRDHYLFAEFVTRFIALSFD